MWYAECMHLLHPCSFSLSEWSRHRTHTLIFSPEEEAFPFFTIRVSPPLVSLKKIKWLALSHLRLRSQQARYRYFLLVNRIHVYSRNGRVFIWNRRAYRCAVRYTTPPNYFGNYILKSKYICILCIYVSKIFLKISDHKRESFKEYERYTFFF